jgi:hypothetical protein
LTRIRPETDRDSFHAAILELLRDYAPAIHARVERDRFELARPLDAACVAITPTVRRAYTTLRSGKVALALGDAHVVLDPITGQGANKASQAAWVVGEAIRSATAFDEEFCRLIEARLCDYAVPVSDACNARLLPPAPHFAGFLGAAAQHQTVADFYADGFNHPDRFWHILSNENRTASVTRWLTTGAIPPVLLPWDALSAAGVSSNR